MGNEIDPVEFGKLIANVASNNERLTSIGEKMEAFVDATNTRFKDHDTEINGIKQDTAVKKGAIIGALGVGSIGGISLTEVGKRIMEKLFS